MSARSAPLNQCKKYLHAMREYRWLWLVPTVGLTLLAGVYASLRPATWKASQAFVVRDEAASGLTHQGRFSSTEALRSFQETILEVARNRTAVSQALQAVGPPADFQGTQWPPIEAVEQVQDSIKVSAPRGGEFGKTEVIYLSVTGGTKQIALDRTEAIYQQLEARLGDLRNAKASSLAREAADKLSLAQQNLDEATSRLETMEREVGSDLGELRILNDSGSGDSNLRASLNQLKLELRQARAAAEANEQQEQMLIAANQDPENLLATSSRLFDAQPNLRRLNEGLLDAQLRSAQLQGKMTNDHPLVKSALDTESQVRRDFYAELAAALRGVRSDLEVNRQQVESLQHQHDATQQRLHGLSSLRARYANLVAEVRQRSDLMESAQQELASARGSQSAADAVSLITRFDTPIVGSSPVGPSRSMIVAAGMLGGLFTGLGLVFLAMPTQNGAGRRWSDYLGYTRRTSDRTGGRRADDTRPDADSSSGNRRATDASAGNRRAADRQPPAELNLADRPVTENRAPESNAQESSRPNGQADTSPAPREPVSKQAIDQPAASASIALPSETSLSEEPSDHQPTPTPSAASVPSPGSPTPELAMATEEPVAHEPRETGDSGKQGESRRSLLASCLSELEQSHS